MIDGLDNHFIHVRSRHSNALPLIMAHGSPGSAQDCRPAYGSHAPWRTRGGRIPFRDAFDSRLRLLRQAEGHWFGPDRIARAWAELMKRFGYTRYVVQGGDSGAPISSAMARQATAGLLSIHINLPATVPSGLAAVLAAGLATPHAWHRNEKFPPGAGATEPGVHSTELLAGECFELLRCTDQFAGLPMRRPHAGYDQDVLE
jgi:Epoxide hydrolase N terminus